MAIRKIVFAEGEVYHVFNRGVAKSDIFSHTKHYARFVDLMEYYRYANVPLSYSSLMKLDIDRRYKIRNYLKHENELAVSILTYCLMPNHFHILLRQISPYGITKFMRHMQDGYAKYFNIASKRVGPLYQSSFKAVRIESDEQLVHVSRYIHLNPVTAYLIPQEKLISYPWSSLPVYLFESRHKTTFVDTTNILSFFKSEEAYGQFVYDQIDYQRELDKIKHITFD